MRENGFRAIGGLAQRMTSGLAKGRGASIARLRAEWSAVVGPDLARTTRPDALVAGRGARGTHVGVQGAGKVLRLRVSGAGALEVQHQTGQIVERVNAYFGHRLIDDIRLVQGAVATRPAAAAVPAPDPQTVREVAARAGAVKDPELRAALTRLGARLALKRRSALLAAVGALVVARDVRAQGLTRDRLLAPLPGDHILGRPDAPNTLIDYASFTCPHCAHFYIAVLPTLRREWIDSGRLRLIHRHFPSDIVATRAAQLSECVAPDKFFATTEALFRGQVEWLTVGDPLVEMVKVLAPQGMTEAAAQACFANDRALDKVVADVQSGQALRVMATPTLFINEENYGNPGGAEAIAAILRQVGR
ncbi:MAG: DciA family protein [Reyranella sp.]|nr:DciA family protein [Reyranella sp.]